MKTVLSLMFLFSVSAIAEVTHNTSLSSVAVCKPTQEGSSYKSFELFYDYESTGVLVVDILTPEMGAPFRSVMIVPVVDKSDFLEVGEASEAIVIKKDDKDATFDIDGVEFKCEKATW